MLQVYVASLFAWHATALREATESASIYGAGRGREWKRAARRARLTGRMYPPDRAHACREVALAAAARGRTRRAKTFFTRSLRAADAFDQRHEHALTLTARGRVGIAAGWAGANDDLEAAATALEELEGHDTTEGAVTVSLLDRFDSV